MDRAEPSEPIRKLTTSNTKKEMLAAYNELLKKLQDKPEKILDAQKRIEQKAVERAVQAADALSTEAVVKQIGILKAEPSRRPPNGFGWRPRIERNCWSKSFTGEKNVLTARIESLEKTVSEQNQLIAKLSQTTEKAYEQVQISPSGPSKGRREPGC